MRNQKIKIGDFGVSLLLNQSDPNQTYSFKGLSPSWCMEKVKKAFEDANR